MNMNRTMTMLVLLTALLVPVAATYAGLPAKEANIWAPVGDLVGTTNHGTVTMSVLDAYGFESKSSEDWQLNDKFSSSLLFGWHTANENGTLMSLRSAGGSRLDGNVDGHLTFSAVQPGKYGFNLDYRGYEHRYDTTSEMRAATFGLTYPSELSETPALNWNRARFSMKYHVNEAWHLDAGLTQTDRKGTKGSLLRGAPGTAAPGLKGFASTSSTFWVRGNYALNRLAASLRFDITDNQGDRSQGSNHTYGDDQLVWNLNLKAKYQLNPRTQLLAGGLMARAANDLTEMVGSSEYLTQNEAKTTAGQLGVVSKITKCTTVNLTGQFKKQDTEAQILADGTTMDNAMTRDRTGTVIQAKLATTILPKSKIQLFYKYNKSDLEEVVAQDALPGVATDFQTTDQERTKQNAGLKFRYRFNRMASLKGNLGWSKTEITETTAGEDLLYKLGDRNLDQLKYQLALGLKPTSDLRMDLGFQAIDQTYERLDEAVETTWATQRGYLIANWTVMPRLTILASASLGQDKYELTDGPVSTGTIGPLMYDGKTLRYAPGVVFSATDKLTLEAIYEGIDFEDKADRDDDSYKLQSDHSRVLLRAGYDVGENARVTAGYRRQEFDENRWDDYILDIYSLSVSGTF